MARSNPPLPDDLKQRKRRTAEVLRRLRAFIGGAPRVETGASFIETLVATILSQNTSDANSARAYRELQAAYPTWDELAAADRAELASCIRSGGLADQKARTIIDVVNSVRERYGGFEPEHLETAADDELLGELTSMKGVGLKTAACVLMFSLGRDVCAVDTHVERVTNRIGLVHASTADRTFHDLRPLIPKGKARQFHVDLILFGRRICKARHPHCFECPVFDLCAWEEKEAHAIAGVRGAPPVSGDLLLLDMFTIPPMAPASAPQPATPSRSRGSRRTAKAEPVPTAASRRRNR